MKKYEEYKNSGIEWIGKIPIAWELVKLSYHTSIFGGSTPNSNIDDYWDGNLHWVTTDDLGKLDGKFIYKTRRTISNKGLANCSATTASIGSVIISTRAPIGHLGILAVVASTNQGCKAIEPNHGAYNSIFIYYFLLAAKTDLQRLGSGSTFTEISTSIVKNYKIVKPSLAEQTTIASFLDHKTSQIDTIIQKKELLIQKLKEQRQAIINEAVTKGLNPDVPMKDSGIEWLGEIPEHWCLSRLDYLSNVIDPQPDHRAPLLDDHGLPYLGIRDINPDGTINVNTARIVNANAIIKQEESFTITDGDIVFGKVGTLAEPKHIKLGGERVALSATLVLIKTQDVFYSRFLKYALDSSYIWDQINTVIVGATRPALGIQQIRKFIIVQPTYSDMQELIDFLDFKTSTLQTLQYKLKNQIDKLKHYRQSIISEAVTGKIDVRDWSPPQQN